MFHKMKNIFLLISTLCCFSVSQEENLSPYKLSWNTDGWLIGSSMITGGIAYAIETNLPSLSSVELQSLNISSINFLDRNIAGIYDESQSNLSDVFVGIAIVSPLCLMVDKDIRKDYFTFGVMYAETGALAAIVPSLCKGIIKRIRPYVYKTSAPIDIRTESDAQRSFFSRHSTVAFATAVFISTVYDDYFPASRYSMYIWASSLGLATAVATLRVTSGSHFPTDVIVGAAVGSGIGYLIPYLHRDQSNNLSFAPQISPHGNGILFSMRF